MKSNSTIILSCLLATLSFLQAAAQETKIMDLRWADLAKARQLQGGTVIEEPGGEAVLKVENPEGTARSVLIAVLEDPKITASFYSVSGEVRYEEMAGDGYLEMWSHFGKGAAYFSRTLGDAGPMAKLAGTSDWRPFVLPFDAKGAGSHPTKLVLNVHFAGKGTVYIRKVHLAQNAGVAAFSTSQGSPWWSDQAAGLIGGGIGALLGCLGSLMEWLTSKGKAPRFVLVTVRVLIVVGVVATVCGLWAILQKQPYSVWFALLMLGGLTLLILPFRMRRYEGQFRAIELRRMSSMDAGSR